MQHIIISPTFKFDTVGNDFQLSSVADFSTEMISKLESLIKRLNNITSFVLQHSNVLQHKYKEYMDSLFDTSFDHIAIKKDYLSLLQLSIKGYFIHASMDGQMTSATKIVMAISEYAFHHANTMVIISNKIPDDELIDDFELNYAEARCDKIHKEIIKYLETDSLE